MNETLIIFAKNPALGHTKTRIGKKLGDEVALAIYYKLINRAQKVTKDLNCSKVVYYSDFIDTEDTWDNGLYIKKKQKSTDLGSRMAHAFEQEINQGAGKVILVGTDIYDLTSEIIEEAFTKLDDYDVVIGPAKDGGYYLIGMKQPNPKIFELEKWSTSTVFHETIKLIESEGTTWTKVTELNDIDESEDLVGTDMEDLLNS